MSGKVNRQEEKLDSNNKQHRTKMNLSQITQVVGTLQPYIIGILGGVSSQIAGGYFKEHFAERERRLKHKINVANQVLKICNEASTGNFKHVPRDTEHVNSVLTDLEGIDQNMETVMNNFVNLWRKITEDSANSARSEDSKRDLIEMNHNMEKDRKILVAWANKIRFRK
jgi:hypothetical protein